MTFYNLEQVCHGTIYGPWMGGQALTSLGFELSDVLTVFAVYDSTTLKMVGLQGNGDQEGRYMTGGTGDITLDIVTQAWASGRSTGSSYLVKDVSFCSTGI